MKNYGNGCGPDWVPRWIKSALFDWFHEASCDKHDEGYSKGGDEARRKVCDKKFLEAMLRDTLRQPTIPSRKIAFVQAWAYYGLVRVFGKSSFNYTN